VEVDHGSLATSARAEGGVVDVIGTGLGFFGFVFGTIAYVKLRALEQRLDRLDGGGDAGA